MERVLGRIAPLCYALLRIVAGFLFACHGAQKLFGVLGGTAVPIVSQRGAAGIIELACGTLIALGLFTSFAAFIASGEMAVAYFQAHAPQSFWPTVNRGELSALYSFLFLYMATRGTVAYGVDKLISADLAHCHILRAEVDAQCLGEAQRHPPGLAVDQQRGHSGAAQLISCQPRPGHRVRTGSGPAVGDEYQQWATARIPDPLQP